MHTYKPKQRNFKVLHCASTESAIHASIDSIFEVIQPERQNKYSFASPLLKMLEIWMAIGTMRTAEIVIAVDLKDWKMKTSNLCLARMNSSQDFFCNFAFLRETLSLVKQYHSGYTTICSQLHSKWGCSIRYNTSHPTHHIPRYTLFIIPWYGNVLQILLQSTLCTFLSVELSLFHSALTYRDLNLYIIVFGFD